jgi:hypothetical protein
MSQYPVVPGRISGRELQQELLVQRIVQFLPGVLSQVV